MCASWNVPKKYKHELWVLIGDGQMWLQLRTDVGHIRHSTTILQHIDKNYTKCRSPKCCREIIRLECQIQTFHCSSRWTTLKCWKMSKFCLLNSFNSSFIKMGSINIPGVNYGVYKKLQSITISVLQIQKDTVTLQTTIPIRITDRQHRKDATFLLGLKSNSLQYVTLYMKYEMLRGLVDLGFSWGGLREFRSP